MSVTKKKIDESAFIIAKDNITNNVQTVVVPSGLQVGLKNAPADLTLTGKFSTSEKDYVANPSNNWNLTIEDHVTIASISTTYSSSSMPSTGYSKINLPKNPRVGQLVIIKDFSGAASVIPLRIFDSSSKTIDGANYKQISSDYGALQFFWQGINWISISNATIASGAAPDSASYVVIGSNAILTNERALAAGSGISIVDGGAGAAVTISATGGGSGDVVGPASSTDNTIVRFDLTTGKLIQNSGVTIDDSNNVTIPGDISVNGGDITTTAATTNLVNAATTINLGSTAVTRTTNIAIGAADQTVTLGSNYGGSYTRIDGGFFGVFISGSLITLTGSSANANLIADARIGAVEIGGLPGYGNSVAMFGHTDLNHAYNNDTLAGMGNYALGQSNDGSTYINSPQNKGIYFLTSGASGLPLGRIYFKTSTLSSELILTGASYFNSNVFLGSSYGQSSTSIYAGTGGIILSGSGVPTIITGSTSTEADAYIGSVEVGTHPFWGRNYAMFSHKDMDNSVDGNAALIQAYDGDTFLGAKSTKSIFIKNGTSFIGKFDNDNVELTGDTSTSTATILGNSYGLSSTNIRGGLFGITLSGSATTIITGSSSTNAEVYIGTAEVGELPYTRTSFPNYFAMFGHKTLDHSSNGNYALVQSYDGDTFLNSANSKSIYLQNAGNLIGYLDNNSISLTGQANTSVATEIGSVYGLSSTTIKGGLFGLILTGSGTTITITGSTTSQADAYIGSAEIGVHPFWGRNYAMFSHKDMDNSVDGNSALIQAYDGDTFLGAKSTKSIFIKNGTSFIGKFDNDNIELTGDTSTSTATVIGNSYGLSFTNIYAGLFGITLSGSGASTTITGSTSGNADAYIGSAEIGTHPYWGRNYAMFGHKDLSNASDGNAALIQSNVGDTFLGAVDNNYLYFKNGIRTLGYFQYSTFFGKSIFSLVGAAGSPTAVTIGNSESSSNLTLNAGSGSIDIGSTPQSRSINIGTGAAVQTVTIGSQSGISSLTLDSGTGNIDIGTSTASGRTINVGTGTANQTISIGNNSLANQVAIYGGTPFVGVGGIYLTGSAGTTYTIGGETGTGTISLGLSTASNTINIGNGTTATGNTQTVNIAASASGTGLAAITIGNTNGASSLALRAGTGDITMSGIVKNSSQPGFLSSLSTSQLNFATSSDVTVLFDSEIFDNASNFNTGTYTFTAPETGKYLFNVAVRIDNVDTAADYYTLYLITSNRSYRLAIIDPGQFAADLVYWHLNGSAIADMDASDTAYIVIRQQAGTAQTDIISATTNSFFSGWLLG
jgi:hypothetical protein